MAFMRWWIVTFRHKVGEMTLEGAINDIPAFSKQEAHTKALRMYHAKIAPGVLEDPILVSVEEDRRAGANSKIVIARA